MCFVLSSIDAPLFLLFNWRIHAATIDYKACSYLSRRDVNGLRSP